MASSIVPGNQYQALITLGEPSYWALEIEKCEISPDSETTATSLIDVLIDAGQVTSDFTDFVELTTDLTDQANDGFENVAFNFIGITRVGNSDESKPKRTYLSSVKSSFIIYSYCFYLSNSLPRFFRRKMHRYSKLYSVCNSFYRTNSTSVSIQCFIE